MNYFMQDSSAACKRKLLAGSQPVRRFYYLAYGTVAVYVLILLALRWAV